MNLARLSADGKLTVPMKILNLLRLKEGDKVLFSELNGKIIIDNASATAILNAQKAFEGASGKLGNPDEDEIQSWVDEIRYGKAR
ncbi:MAG: AbrB/MazE/SpoVT family DNA-binding domain-containing protein [Synergistaceae bacterium]|nr:AbrB/MazE/SpoVT family DNA-binding domain-containing protein [Synergistaceae bacterium]